MKFRHLFETVKLEPGLAVCRSGDVTMRVDALENMLRVAMTRDGERLLPTWSVCLDGKMPLEGRDKLSLEGFETVPAEIRRSAEPDGGETLRFTHCGCDVSIELMNFRITVKNGRGVLYQDRSGLAYNFDHELGDGSAHFTRREEGQRIFGLGDKCGSVNKNGRSFAIGATDSMGFKAESSDPLYKQIPFYICENSAGSYGLYYDTYSNGRMDFGAEHDNYFEPFNSARFEEEGLVFYLIFGSTAEIVRRFTRLCGGAAPVPGWAFRYCGSTMEYTDAPDADRQLRGFVRKCEEYGLRAGGFYMSSGYTQIGEERCVFHWNTDKIPSPEGLAEYFRGHGMELIPNVKPAFLTSHPLYEKIA
ncbi:MAG: alpha-glucosidase, partial [Firmicutes bacterium]|nr:alpha-glucosidase [Bacillota bacterium]